MALLDLMGRRWTLRILWELREGPLRFRALRERCNDLSPTILNQRLRELREAGIASLVEQGYCLTTEGKDLLACLAPLNRWAERWEDRLRPGVRDQGSGVRKRKT
jgi:DNA-binding HxlR family transcriptional regulator